MILRAIDNANGTVSPKPATPESNLWHRVLMQWVHDEIEIDETRYTTNVLTNKDEDEEGLTYICEMLGMCPKQFFKNAREVIRQERKRLENPNASKARGARYLPSKVA